MFILICRYNRVSAYPGDDVLLSSHLSPETSAVAMEVRWFRGTDCVYLYKNGHVSVAKGYEGRASLFTQELKNGNVSLILKSITPADTGTYSCQVLTGPNKVEKSIHLYMSGTEPISPDRVISTPVEQNSMDVELSVLILELKALLQQREKELRDKSAELEATTEMLKTKTSLALYANAALEEMSRSAAEKDGRLKDVMSELTACKGQVEQLGRELREKTAQVEELRVILREENKHKGHGLTNVTPDTSDTEESVHLNELKKLIMSREEELTRTAKLLRDRNADAENLAKERDEYKKYMAAEMEMCLRELEALGRKLQEEKDRRGESERVITEILSRSDALLRKTFQTPKEQLEAIESWISKRRAVRRLREEEERTKALEKEFLDYALPATELIGKKREKIAASVKMTAVFRNKLELVGTAEEKDELEEQLKNVLEMQRQAEKEIERLTGSVEEKKSGIEERYKQEIEEIRENYSAVSKVEAETHILKIILPDVQAYYRDIAANVHRTLEALRRLVDKRTRQYANVARAHKEKSENRTGGPAEDGLNETEQEAARSVNSSSETDANRVEDEEADARLRVARDTNNAFKNDGAESEMDDSRKGLNGVIAVGGEENEKNSRRKMK